MKFIQYRPALLSIIISAFCVSILISLSPMRYETIDDFFMYAIASGYVGGIPDEHLLYSNFIIGLFLKTLFIYLPNINWYGFYLITVHIIAWAVILRVLFKYFRVSIVLLLFSYLFLAFGVYFIQNLQFTTSAAILGVAGIFLLFERIQTNEFKISKLLLPVSLIIISALIRFQPILLDFIILSPLFILFLPNKRKFFKSLALVALLFIISYSTKELNRWYYYQDKGWTECYDNLYETYIFNDNNAFYMAHYLNPQKPYRALGWSDNDLAIFTSFFRDYPPIFNQNAYNSLSRSMKKVPYDKAKFKSSLKSIFSNIHLIACVFSFLILVPFKHFLPIAISLILIVIAAAIIAINLNFKDRVLFPIIFCLSLLIIFILFYIKENGEMRKIILLPVSIHPLLPIGAMLALLMLALNTFRNQIIKNYDITIKNKALLNNQLKVLNNPSKTYAFFGSSIKFEAESPFATHFHKLGLPKVYPISAFNKSPLYIDEFKLLGNGEFTQMLLNEKVSLVTKNGNVYGSSPENMQLFYAEHFKCDAIIRSDNVYEDAGIRIYSLGPCVNIPDSPLYNPEKHK
jgi:hypothetical protein